MSTLRQDYDSKAMSYFEYERPEMLELVPENAVRILDVGCGSGRFGSLVKKRGHTEVWGIEPSEQALKQAQKVLDRAFCAEFQESVALPKAFFDVVVFNDVLEHMPDPWAALTLARSLLTPNGMVLASIPSIRHFPTLWRLVVRKQWRYQAIGTLDKTHLRFFTCQTIEEMFRESGYDVRLLRGINPFHSFNGENNLWRLFKALNFLTLGQIGDMKYLQFAVRAIKTPES